MKKDYLKMLSTLFIATLLIAGCQKDTKEINYDFGFHKDGCRLLSNSSEFGGYTYTYNRRGLVDQWTVTDYGNLKMEYNFLGRLIKSRLYTDGVLINTIVFFYQGDRVVKETWYDGSTQNKVDEVFYSYNNNGKVWKSQSFINDYYSFYHYTPDGGSVDGWKFYFGGKLNYEQQFTYLPPHHKMPDEARPGLNYSFITSNGWWDAGRWWSTSEKDISYDENGENPVVLVDQDPTKTVVTVNGHNYPLTTNFFDNLTQDYVHFKFDYDNCGQDDGNQDDRNSANPSQKSPTVNSNMVSPIRFLKLGSSKSIKEQVKEFRKQYLNKE
jgi:hypothetical protein